MIPEKIFSADIGELFVIRVAGNVLDRHQLGSIEYAAAHLHCDLIIVLGHTKCGAVDAALAIPGARIFLFDDDNIRECSYTETPSYQISKRFVNDTDRTLKRLLDRA